MQGHAFFIRKMAWDIDGKNENIGAVALDSVVTIYQVDIGYFLLYYISVEAGLPH